MTPKQHEFVKIYLETGNASQAYRRAYNAENMKVSAIYANASKLLKNTQIALRLKALQHRAQARTDITVETLTQKLDRALEKAMAEPKGASAAVSAIMAIGKLHGLIVDKKEVTSKRDAGDYSDAELYEIAGLGRARTDQTQGSTQESDCVH